MKYWMVLCCLLSINQIVKAQDPNLKQISENFIFEEGKHFKQCHASTLVESKNGDIHAAWFAGTHEGNSDVVIWSSTFLKNNWTDPKVVATGKMDDGQVFPCWNPVLFRPKLSNTIYLYYKVGPNPREWWGMVKTSNDNGKTWSSATRLAEGILGPIKNKPIELKDGTVLSPSSIERTETRWIAHVEISNDNQKTWKYIPIDTNAHFNVIQPSILVHQDGKLQVLCRSREGKVIAAFSYDNGKSWESLQPTNLINPNSATDAIAWKDKFLIIYNPDIPGKDWWEGRAKLRLAWSSDGLTWNDLLTLEDQEKGEYSYPTIIKDSKDRIHITYTYDRKNIKHIVLK